MGACEDNCCRNTTWKITVDRGTYEKYKTLDTKLGEHIINCIEEQKGQLMFKEFDHGHCPLLAENGLCTIHRDLGPEFLCKTCTTYPRTWSGFNGQLEYWLSLSCPDVIRWVLYRKKSIKYMKFPIKLGNTPIPTATPMEVDRGKVREMLIKIAQHRKFTLKERLIYMGLFMRSISNTPKSIYAHDKHIDNIITAYNNNMHKPDRFAQMQTDLSAMHPDNRVDIFSVLAQAAAASARPPKIIPKGIKNAEYYERIGKFNNDIKLGTAEIYLIGAFDKIITPYVNDNPHIFENYLMYSLVSSKFLNDAKNMAQAFAGFVGEFATMLVYTAGLFEKNETLTHDEMIIGMYLFHRTISHNQSLRKRLSTAFHNNLLNMLLGALGDIK